MLLGADIGGTFTDIVWWTGTELVTHKVSTTPARPEDALLAGIEELAANRADVLVVHGSTVATNALLERKGARVTLVTTAGFADVLEIGRQNRIGIYDPRAVKPAPLVPAERRIEVSERLDADGTPLLALEDAEIARIARAVAEQQPQAVAICFLHAYANAAHEQRTGAALRAITEFVYLSSDVDPAYREYERASTTVLNAYVAPLVARYVETLRAHVRGPLRLIGSHGGRQTSAALGRPAAMILSGPAGGVIAARAVARAAGLEDVITLDMGGTSTDVALIPGEPLLTRESVVEGLPLRTPMLDIFTIGAGGGSLARLDRGGALVVGPESAGADPGPASYGRGGTGLTVTDAHVLLGHLLPEQFLGGRMRLDRAAAERAAAMVSADGLADARSVAAGVLAVADAAMERAVRTVSARRGFDPEQFTLFCFGGAGGLHAVALARALGMRGVLVPRLAGVLSALGMVLADTLTTAHESVLRDANALSSAAVDERLERLRQVCLAEMAADGDGHSDETLVTEPALELRYRGQSYELIVAWQGSLDATAAAFHREHERRFGYADPARAVEVVNTHVAVRAVNRGVPLPELPQDAAAPPMQTTEAWFGGQAHPTGVYALDALARDQRIAGPAILAGAYTTVLIPPGDTASIDRFGNVHVTLTS